LAGRENRCVRRVAVEFGETNMADGIESRFPPTWDERRVQQLIAEYDALSDEEWIAEDEASANDATQATITVPADLLPEIRRLIAAHRSA